MAALGVTLTPPYRYGTLPHMEDHMTDFEATRQRFHASLDRIEAQQRKATRLAFLSVLAMFIIVLGALAL